MKKLIAAGMLFVIVCVAVISSAATLVIVGKRGEDQKEMVMRAYHLGRQNGEIRHLIEGLDEELIGLEVKFRTEKRWFDETIREKERLLHFARTR